MSAVPSQPPSSNPRGIALRALDVAKSFGPTAVLRGVSLALERGEAHALLGENGSGKSTLAKILCGVHAADGGQVQVGGASVAIGSPSQAARLGIGMVFQELSLAPQLGVVDNLFLGRERRRGGVWVDRAAQRAAAAEVLARVGLDVALDAPVWTLSMAQKQLVEIAKILLQRPGVIIFDEPTARLAEAEVRQLFRIIAALKADGIAILYVTHHLREILEVCDRVSLIRDGRITATQPITAETSEQRLVALLTGGEGAASRRSAPPRHPGRPLLQVEGLAGGGCRAISFEVRPGEVVGLYGVIGCGRESLMRTLAGLARAETGEVRLDGHPYAARSPREALARGVAYLGADRKEGGIFPGLALRTNLTISMLGRLARRGLVDAAAERAAAARGLAEQKVRHQHMEQPISALSGGNQQKLLFGRAFAAGPKLLVLEDPTAGIDVRSKHDLYQRIDEAKAAGTAFLWASSDIVETLALCDRVYAMRAGRIVAELVAPTPADEPRLLACVLGSAEEPLHA